MKLQEIKNGLVSGSITFYSNGYNRFHPMCNDLAKILELLDESKERLDSRLERIKAKDLSEGEMNNKLSLYDEYPTKIGDYIEDLTYYCYDTAENLKLLLRSDSELHLISTKDFFDKANLNNGYRYPSDVEVPQSSLSKLDIKDNTITTEIEVKTGKLIFTNFFTNVSEDDVEYKREFNICGILGRYNTAQYLSQKNIGYGQMGNMSLEVWKKDDGTEILLTDSCNYRYDEETQEESEIVFEYDGYKHIGHISLSMWRWMCADSKVLEDAGEKVPEILLDSKVEVNYRDWVCADVKPGTYVINHYYDLQGNRDDGVYTKISLK